MIFHDRPFRSDFGINNIPGRGTRMILIIDDNPADIELAVIAIEDIGQRISVRSAQSGAAALEMLREESELPSLILIDLKMPGIDGIEVIRKIRADEHLKNIPAVVLTSSALDSDKSAALAAGASGYVQKPVTLSQFKKYLRFILNCWMPDMRGLLFNIPHQCGTACPR